MVSRFTPYIFPLRTPDESDTESDGGTPLRVHKRDTFIGSVDFGVKPKVNVKDTYVSVDYHPVVFYIKVYPLIEVEDYGSSIDRLWDTAVKRLDGKRQRRLIYDLEGRVTTSQSNAFRLLLDDIQRQQNTVIESRLAYTGKDVGSSRFNAKDVDGNSSLMEAAVLPGDEVEMARLLLDNEADIETFNRDEISVLDRAVMKRNKEVVKELIPRGIKIDRKDNAGRNILHICAIEGRLEMLKIFLEAGMVSEIDTLDWSRHQPHPDLELSTVMTPLHLAVERGHLPIANELITRGASVNVEATNSLWTPLHDSVKGGYLEITELLLKAGVDPNAANEDGITCLHYCWRTGSVPLASLLLSHGADIHAKQNNQSTVLHCACYEGRRELAEFLIANGANMEDETKEGFSPLRVAMMRNHWDIAEMLIENGADVNHKDRKSWMPLHGAVGMGQKRGVEILVAVKGVDLEGQNEGFLTAIGEALKDSKYEIVEILARAGANLETTSYENSSPP
ncbi:hypothetical protein TWF481_008991 [Arthrobotrys musiformis]|uniref:Uncharacterized protein n=1 Tax=Arthrobotrys musiformis TaxID=47236 RepID=A0AAV9W3L5_9PEZI